MNHLKKLEEEVSTWPHVSVHAHRFGGGEFLFDKAEVGHVHTGGIVDIPFPRPVRDALLAELLLKSTTGFPILAGSLFTFATRKTSSTPSGSCGCRISDMH